MVPCFRDSSKIVCLLPHFSSLLHLSNLEEKTSIAKPHFHVLPALWPENIGSFSSCSNLNHSKKWFWLALLRLYAYLWTKLWWENWVLCLARKRSCFTFPFSRELEDFNWDYKPGRVGEQYGKRSRATQRGTETIVGQSVTKLSFLIPEYKRSCFISCTLPHKEEECDWRTYRRAIYEKQDRHLSAS